MDNNEIISKIKTILLENYKIKLPDELKGSEKLFDDLGIDSITLLHLFVFLEEAFDILIPEDEIRPDRLITLDNLTNFIKEILTVKK